MFMIYSTICARKEITTAWTFLMSPLPVPTGILLDRLVCYLMPYFLHMTSRMDLAGRNPRNPGILRRPHPAGARQRRPDPRLQHVRARHAHGRQDRPPDFAVPPASPGRLRQQPPPLIPAGREDPRRRLKCDHPTAPAAAKPATSAPATPPTPLPAPATPAIRNLTPTRKPSAVYNAIFGDVPKDQ
jgi:hypothetical protein